MVKRVKNCEEVLPDHFVDMLLGFIFFFSLL